MLAKTTTTVPEDTDLITKILTKQTKKCSAQGNIKSLATTIIDTAKRQFQKMYKKAFQKYTRGMYYRDIQYILDLIKRGDTVHIPILNESNSKFLAKSLGLNEDETREYMSKEFHSRIGEVWKYVKTSKGYTRSIFDIFSFEYPLPERVILEWGDVSPDGRWVVPYSLDTLDGELEDCREPTFKKNMLHEGLMIPDNIVRFTTKGPLGAAIQAIAEEWCDTEGIVGSIRPFVDDILYPSGKVFIKTFEDHFNGQQVSLTIPARELFTPYDDSKTGERGVALKNVIKCRLKSDELRQVVIVPLFDDIAIDFPEEKEGSTIKDTRKMDGFFRNIILKARKGREEAEDARPNEYSLFDFNPEEPLASLFHQAKLRAEMHGVSCEDAEIDYFNEKNISKKIKLDLDVTGPERIASIVDWYTRHSICPYPVDMCDIHGFNIPIAGNEIVELSPIWERRCVNNGFYYGYIPARTKLEYMISGHFNAPYEKGDDGNFNFTLPTHSYQKANGEHGYFTRKKEYAGYKHIRIGEEVCPISPLVRTTPIRKL